MTRSEAEFERISHWRFYWDWAWVMVPWAGMVYVCERVHFGFYFLFLFFLGNRFYRLGVLGHEGLHFLISRNLKWNTFLARYFCHFPTLISHARYKAFHAIHHRCPGQVIDPDFAIYSVEPGELGPFLWRSLRELVNLQLVYVVFDYFTELPERWNRLWGREPQHRIQYKSDFPQYVMFWIVIIALSIYFDFWQIIILYWLIPGVLHLPMIRMTNFYQHGGHTGGVYPNRTVTGWPFLMDLFIPLDLNYHHEHHRNARVPHYNLPAYSRYLDELNPAQSRDHLNVVETSKAIFRKTT